MECLVCAKTINYKDKYYTCEDNKVKKIIEKDGEENIFCSKKCFCEYLSLIEDINEEEDICESEDCEYDPTREEEVNYDTSNKNL